MELDETRTAVVMALLLAIVVAPTLSSPMPRSLRYGISVGFVAVCLLAFAVGTKFGEYRAGR
jgi:hypothetical protein